MNNKGDLISREALKKDMSIHFYTSPYYKHILDVIDNAPTVEVKPIATVTFDKDELERIVEERVIEPIKNGELVLREEKAAEDE